MKNVEYREYKGAYLVGSDGTVLAKNYRNVPGNVHPRRPYVNKKGYWFISLYPSKTVERWSVHRLVATVFLGHHPGLEVNHKDGDKSNNNLDNLEFVTSSQNKLHAHSTGLCDTPAWVANKANLAKQAVLHFQKVTPEQRAEISWKYHSGFANQPALSREYGISQVHVSRIARSAHV